MNLTPLQQTILVAVYAALARLGALEHPPLWRAVVQLRREIEKACDMPRAGTTRHHRHMRKGDAP